MHPAVPRCLFHVFGEPFAPVRVMESPSNLSGPHLT